MEKSVGVLVKRERERIERRGEKGISSKGVPDLIPHGPRALWLGDDEKTELRRETERA